jgi:CDP-diacylglycerol pyrophosphatase
LMFLWPVVIAIISAITVFVFLESTKLIELWRVNCPKCSTENAKNSNYCKHCAYKINKKI